MYIPQKPNRILIFLAGLLLPWVSIAKPNEYQINLVVFSHITPQALTSQQWPFVIKKPIAAPTHNLLPEQSSLQTEVKKLRQAGYKILIESSWREYITRDHFPIALHIYGGKAFSKQGDVMAQPNDLDYQQAAAWEVDGTLKIALSQYVNLKFNLYFTEPSQYLRQMANTSIFNNSKPFLYFHFVETRRTRSGILNYLDNPLYGALVLVNETDQ